MSVWHAGQIDYGIGTSRSKFVSVLTRSKEALDGEVFGIGQDQRLPGLASRMSAANLSNSRAARSAVRAEVPVVKQMGWPVSTSSTKNV